MAGKTKSVAKKGKAAEKKVKTTNKKVKAPKPIKLTRPDKSKKETILKSEVVYEGPLFRVVRNELLDPDGNHSKRELIRHNGSVVILAVDNSKSKRDPLILVERQYRHAAGQYLWELPAGKLEAGEEPLTGAQRELAEETGYHAKKWKLLVEYYASPGFLGESMKVYLAEKLVAGEAHQEEDEHIQIHMVKLSEVLKAIDKGIILDGKTLTSVQLYARKLKSKG
jgi:ADP-ribose pyrophosphatase